MPTDELKTGSAEFIVLSLLEPHHRGYGPDQYHGNGLRSFELSVAAGPCTDDQRRRAKSM
jgi:hypothetical protein